jgi:hypothetical protein
MLEPREIIRHNARNFLEPVLEARAWADQAEERIEIQLAAPGARFIQAFTPELLGVGIRLLEASDIWFDKPTPEQRDALSERYPAKGWHYAEVDEKGGFIRLAMMRKPVVVTLVDGTSFEASFYPDLNARQQALRIAASGTWRYTSRGRELIPPHRIACVRVEDLASPVDTRADQGAAE